MLRLIPTWRRRKWNHRQNYYRWSGVYLYACTGPLDSAQFMQAGMELSWESWGKSLFPGFLEAVGDRHWLSVCLSSDGKSSPRSQRRLASLARSIDLSGKAQRIYCVWILVIFGVVALDIATYQEYLPTEQHTMKHMSPLRPVICGYLCMVHTTKLLAGLKKVCPDEWCEIEWQERVFKEVSCVPNMYRVWTSWCYQPRIDIRARSIVSRKAHTYKVQNI